MTILNGANGTVGIYSQSALLPRRNHAGQHAQANAATHSDVG